MSLIKLITASGILLGILGYALNPSQFIRSYLFSYLYWLDLSLGAFAINLLIGLTGGQWGQNVQKSATAATRTLPAFALFFLPIALSLDELYHWARPGWLPLQGDTSHKKLYFSIPFFGARALIYLLGWSLLSTWMPRKLTKAKPTYSALCLIFYFLSVSFSSIDWVMSLEPQWQSSVFGLLAISGQGLSAFSWLIAATTFLENPRNSSNPKDLGNLLLAFVITWSYLSFMQYLIIWAGNLPKEVVWYIHRSQGGWQWVLLALTLLQFGLPFFLLLMRPVKRSYFYLATISVLLLGTRAANVFWMVMPSFFPRQFHIHWLDAALFLAMGGAWVLIFLASYSKVPLYSSPEGGNNA